MSKSVTIKRFGGMIGGSRRMRRVYSMIRKGASVDMPVLIVGETGSGKGFAARELHARSERSAQPLVAFNTGAIAPELVASELFGHKKGAFTGAAEDKVGRLREANGGTLFLDEVGTMDARMQVALLRALDEKKIRPIGAKRDVRIDFRLVAATNENLEQAVKEGRFRDDLLYRLKVLCIKLPALRHRIDDIPMLCVDFLDAINRDYGFDIQGVSDPAMEALQQYAWPGNLRELKNVLAQATVTATKDSIALEHLPRHITAAVSGSDIDRRLTLTPVETAIEIAPEVVTVPEQPGHAVADGDRGIPSVRGVEDGLFIPIGTTLEEVQRAYTLKTLESCNNNKTQAAKLLNVSRKALYDKLIRWGENRESN